MSQYDNTNKGALWKKRDDAIENAPDWKIEFNVNGCDWVLAYWKRKPTDNHNGPWGRFTIENKTEQQQASAGQTNAAAEPNVIIDDDVLPF
jgi:hypothetical protein